MKLAPMPANYTPNLTKSTNWAAFEETRQILTAFNVCNQSRMRVVDDTLSKQGLVRRLASHRGVLIRNGYPQFKNIRVRHDTKADMVYLERLEVGK